MNAATSQILQHFTGIGLRSAMLRLLIFLAAAKILLLSGGWFVAQTVQLSPERYFVGFHHFGTDPRIAGLSADFFTTWIYGDAEWYLSIAARGYPTREMFDGRGRIVPPYRFAPYHPLAPFYKFTEADAFMKYAFFPLFPLLVRLLQNVLPLSAAAFVVANCASLAALLVLFHLVLRLGYGEEIAFRTVVLVGLYPFSAFFQSYYPEGLFLLLSTASFLLFEKEKYAACALCGSLLALTKGVGVLIVLPLLWAAARQKGNDLFSIPGTGTASGQPPSRFLVALIPCGLIPFLLLNHFNTGSWTFFNDVLAEWGYGNGNPIENLVRNLATPFLHIASLDWMYFHSSRIDALAMLAFLALLVAAFRRIPRPIWLFAALLWLVPLLRKDLMSFTRYMSVAFPFFLALAIMISRRAFLLLATLFGIGLLIVSCMMVEWFWIG